MTNTGMREIHLGDQTIRFDPVKTKAVYAAMKSGSPERCGCPYCRNFLVQRNLAYPERFRQLLDQLGIEPNKEADVHGFGPVGSLVQYGGWFYLSGELIMAGERLTDGGPSLEYFFRASHRPKTLPELGEEVLALEFSTKLQWVLPEEPEWALKSR